MKNFLFTKILFSSVTIFTCLLSSSVSVANPSKTAIKESTKSSVEYRCIKRNGIPTTIANTHKGVIELIVWKNDYFSGSGYPPERRCREVTARFQKHSDAKNLRYISTGIINRYNVICVSEKSGNCKQNGLLITLPHKDNPEQVMRDLFNLSARRSGGGITRVGSRNRPLKEMIDIEQFLAESPVIDNITNPNQSSDSETVAPNPSVTPENETTPNNDKPVIENPFENF